MKASLSGLIAALALAMPAGSAAAAEFFVAPDGSDGNSGTQQTKQPPYGPNEK